MIRKWTKIIVLASLAVVSLAAWHVATAKAKKKEKGNKTVLSAAAGAAIKKAFPKATIDQVQREKRTIVLYEVQLKQNGKEVEVEVSPDGRIVEVGRKVATRDLPKAVAKTLAKLAGDAKIKEIEKEEIHAVLTLARLRRPRVVYEAEFVRNAKAVEVRIAPDGRLLGKEIEDEEDDDDGDDDDDEDEKEVSLDQVPAAVKATILKEAGKNRIKEIEVETRGGRKIYEAEWVADGKEIEIRVASDGKLLGREVEDEDDDD